EGGTVDDAELTLLYFIELAALSAMQDLGQEQDRRERRTHVVCDLDDEVEAAALRQLRDERLISCRRARLLRPLEPVQRVEHGRGVRKLCSPLVEDGLTQRIDEPAPQRGNRAVLVGI